MRTVAIITSRWQSTRIPGKALIDINGKPLLQWVVNGVKEAKHIDDVVVATTTSSEPIIEYCQEHKIDYYVGSENDILSRLYECAKTFKADEIIRIWGDSVFIGICLPSIMNHYQVTRDIFAYHLYEDIPTSYKVAMFPFRSLEIANREATDPNDREWAHNYMMERFRGSLEICYHRDMNPRGNFLIDTQEDLEKVREWYERGKTPNGRPIH